jgi:hypothetical protein
MEYPEAVSDLVSETTRLLGTIDGLIVIRRERVWSDGTRLGGELRIEPRNAMWLADRLDLAAKDALSDVEYDATPDHLEVFVRGGERGAPIHVHVLNERDSGSVHSGTFALGAMSPETARQLARDLRECVQRESAR